MWSGPPDGKGQGEAQPPFEPDAIAREPADPAAPPPPIESSVQASLGLPVSQSIPSLGLQTPPSLPLANFPLAAQGPQAAANNAAMAASLTDSILAHLQRNLTQGALTTTENLVAMMGLLSPAVGTPAWPSLKSSARRIGTASLNTVPLPAGLRHYVLLWPSVGAGKKSVIFW